MPSPETSSGEKVSLYQALTIELYNINMANSVGNKWNVEAKLIIFIIFYTFGAHSIKLNRDNSTKLNITNRIGLFILSFSGAHMLPEQRGSLAVLV